MSKSDFDFKIPEKLPIDPNSWKVLATRHGVLHKNVHDLENLDSASRIGDEQFYALRVYWHLHVSLLSKSQLCEAEAIKNAKIYLKENDSWHKYLQEIKANVGSPPLSNVKDIGSFSLVRYNQERTFLIQRDLPATDDEGDPARQKVFAYSPMRLRSKDKKAPPNTPTPMQRDQPDDDVFDMTSLVTPLREIRGSPFGVSTDGSSILPSPESPANPAESLPSPDEIIVNMALNLFLENLTIYHSDINRGGSDSPRWTAQHLPLKCGTWKAWTDGFLQIASDGRRIGAIMEVKPYIRATRLFAILKQESAQMAAWIYQYPHDGFPGSNKRGPCFRRLLISQDSFEIYLNLAEYDSAYISYIRRDEQAMVDRPSLMKINQYGPWNTKNSDHMKQLGTMMLAFTLQHVSNDSDPFTDFGKGKSRA
ncbi:hypothetical protein MMC07_003155 [Pseudocyphellaria aurata]|nr:hypothetical protein [Pseudocyphellaria aurata]